MLHWNSLWAPTTPDGKTELETAPVWKEPWPAEQLMAWQTLGWEQMLNASHAWWALLMSAWSFPSWATASDTSAAAPKAANDEQITPPRKPAPTGSRSSSARRPRSASTR